ncbi:hypothetical protein LTR27_000637 [Elasticomyces elasticus]|nr:hypothetical protein LTR27_000637 [Elasticomyces elasticus]
MLVSRPAARYICAQCRAFSTTRRSLAEAAEVKRLGVVGAGQMGLGIALVASRMARVPVVVVDNSQKSLDRGLAFADKLLAKDVGKGKLSQSDADETRSRLTTTTSMDPLSEVDMVIEAVPEIVDLKKSIFAQLAQICPQHAILATNTSSISITQIARATTQDPTDLSAASRVISTHFMNPVPVQKGVEIISGLQTSASTLATAIAFCKAMGKIPSVSGDSPGFLANRILMPYINEAIICLETGVGGEEDIDGIMKNGTGVPMGPLALADFIGLDTCLSIMEVLHTGLGDRLSPAANAVLHTAELPEMILLGVTAKTVLLSLRVCTAFHTVITRSQWLQKKLFLLPATFEEAVMLAAAGGETGLIFLTRIGSEETIKQGVLNPLLFTIGHVLFRTGRQTAIKFGRLGDLDETQRASRLRMQLIFPAQVMATYTIGVSHLRGSFAKAGNAGYYEESVLVGETVGEWKLRTGVVHSGGWCSDMEWENAEMRVHDRKERWITSTVGEYLASEEALQSSKK